MTKIAAMLLVALGTSAAQDQTWRTLFLEVQRLRDLGDYARSRGAAQEALEAAERFHPPDARLGITLAEAAWLDHTLGRSWVAEKAYRRAIPLLELPPVDSRALARTLNDLATLYTEFGQRHAAAEQLRRRALAIGVAFYGPRHPEVAALLSNLASTRLFRGDRAEARALLERSLELLENAEPRHGPGKASVLCHLAMLLHQAGEVDKGLSHLRSAAAFYGQIPGDEHPDLIMPLFNLGLAYLKFGQPALAGPPLRRAAAITEARLGTEHPYLVEIYSTLAIAERKTGARKEARRHESRARAIMESRQFDRAIGQSRVDLEDLSIKPKAPPAASPARTRH